jgi:hypothetical protein
VPLCLALCVVQGVLGIGGGERIQGLHPASRLAERRAFCAVALESELGQSAAGSAHGIGRARPAAREGPTKLRRTGAVPILVAVTVRASAQASLNARAKTGEHIAAERIPGVVVGLGASLELV